MLSASEANIWLDSRYNLRLDPREMAYLAVMIDLFSQRVVGDRPHRSLALVALRRALATAGLPRLWFTTPAVTVLGTAAR